jgi:hypothetical protein
LAGQQGRCGYGPRLPLLVISPWAKHNYVDHTLTDQSSILKFVEDNWRLPRIPGSFDAIAGSLGAHVRLPAAQRLTLEHRLDLSGQLDVGRVGHGRGAELGVGLAAAGCLEVVGDEVVGVDLGLRAGGQLLAGVLLHRGELGSGDRGAALGREVDLLRRELAVYLVVDEVVRPRQQ